MNEAISSVTPGGGFPLTYGQTFLHYVSLDHAPLVLKRLTQRVSGIFHQVVVRADNAYLLIRERIYEAWDSELKQTNILKNQFIADIQRYKQFGTDVQVLAYLLANLEKTTDSYSLSYLAKDKVAKFHEICSKIPSSSFSTIRDQQSLRTSITPEIYSLNIGKWLKKLTTVSCEKEKQQLIIRSFTQYFVKEGLLVLPQDYCPTTDHQFVVRLSCLLGWLACAPTALGAYQLFNFQQALASECDIASMVIAGEFVEVLQERSKKELSFEDYFEIVTILEMRVRYDVRRTLFDSVVKLILFDLSDCPVRIFRALSCDTGTDSGVKEDKVKKHIKECTDSTLKVVEASGAVSDLHQIIFHIKKLTSMEQAVFLNEIINQIINGKEFNVEWSSSKICRRLQMLHENRPAV